MIHFMTQKKMWSSAAVTAQVFTQIYKSQTKDILIFEFGDDEYK